jgi:Radical SAM superfamily/4Fe-4S single cluster domain
MTLNHNGLYRLPWNYADNIIAWLEPTKECNIYCEGCYSANNPASHKTLDQINQDLDVFEKYRKTHSVSIAGGDPLTHPQIVDIVKIVAQRGFHPIINTNGLSMSEDLMKKLKKAGMRGVTYHIDSLQHREGWTGKTEVELNDLRYHYAKMTARVGGLSCAFNATVYDQTIKYIPDMLDWAHKNMDIVHIMVFINFRAADLDKLDYYANGEKIDLGGIVYAGKRAQNANITSQDVIEEIRKKYHDFQPCAFLNGTEDPSAMKWLMTLRVGTKKRILGYFGPKFAEITQVFYHLLHGKYLGYVHPRTMRHVRRMFVLGLFDKGVRKAFFRWILTLIPNIFNIFRRVYMQSIMIIQPVDVLEDGRQSMCDGCPDMTAYKGNLVWSCRLEEPMKYGCFLHAVVKSPKSKPEQKESVRKPIEQKVQNPNNPNRND